MSDDARFGGPTIPDAEFSSLNLKDVPTNSSEESTTSTGFGRLPRKLDANLIFAGSVLVSGPSPAALNEDIIGRYLGGDPSSELYYDTAKNWIQACLTHSKCNKTVSGSTRIDPRSSPLPTRVIELTREGGRQRLHLRETEGLHDAYITLTHRWNNGTELCKQPPKITKRDCWSANLASYHNYSGMRL
ncbi:uncharacterized protein PAC_10035 [Phialocephala subalpina]|uniref:Uncharacterized protein n=1 Tax=Phialocephala subalpina TaxID=576137 RepID=A0A1L7X534_9HELO|nr:uncharacterized protein PAC_10035 [Phialocephala subalpina]